jgi:exodeoxyribonuclease V gamma subunit
MEELVAELAERVAAPPAGGDPLWPETIAVQGRGMERWLSLELSRRLGVWANAWFPFPRSLIERAFDAVLGPAPREARIFDPEELRFSIAALLVELRDRPELAPLSAALREESRALGEDSMLRRLQLAARIAEVFDRYVTYRPQMIRGWDRGSGDGAPAWQVALWRALVARHGEHHFAARAEAFLAALESAGGVLAGLPARIHVFGVTTLPPLYVDLLSALSRRVELHLFVLTCTRAPLSDASGSGALWPSLGSVGRGFHELLAGRAGGERLCAAFRDPGDATVLRALQRAILEGDAPPATPRPVVLADRSIQVHACHGPLREVEVLHDQLCALLEGDPGLEPRDVIVMTPDVETYAPFIEAVFSAGSPREGERPQLGHRIADRGARATQDVVDAYWRLLEALQGRLEASAVVDLLLLERIRRRFGIEVGDLDLLIEWIEDAGIRWAADARHRLESGQPPVSQNTWREGLDRLLLGVALSAEGEPIFLEQLPVGSADPARLDLLGRFVDFCETLFACRERVSGERPVRAFCLELAEVLEATIDRDDGTGGGAEQHARIRSALADLAERAQVTGFSEPVGLRALLHELAPRLEEGLSSHRFLSGGITFCEMIPMRSIPFRVVALLGMNDESFPRGSEPLGFDLVSRFPRTGDRTPREDDRYLFLEAIVSARDHLLVTYTARSLRDGSERAPSVVVSELLDELMIRFAGERGSLRDQLVTLHPRQAFDPRYFDGSDARLSSYSRADCAGARALSEARAAPERARAPFVRTPLAAPESASQVDLDRLARFFEHPVRAFLQERLGLYLRDELPDLEDREPIELDALARWKLGDRLLRSGLAGLPLSRPRDVLRAAGALPLGAAGEIELDRCAARVGGLLDAVRSLRGGDRGRVVPVDLAVAGRRITGALRDVWPAGRVVCQYSSVPHRAELAFWVRHLAWSCVAPEAGARESFLVAQDRKTKQVSVLRLRAVADAEARLADLLELYERGRCAPLPLAPSASREQADLGFEKGWLEEVAPAIAQRWETARRDVPPESRDPYLHQAFGDIELLAAGPVPGGDDFASLARRIYEPYLEAREELA